MRKVLMILMMGVMLMGCSDDLEQQGGVVGEPLQLSAVTRSSSDIVAAKDSLSPIQIFLMSGLQKTEGNFVYNSTSEKWVSTIGVKEDDNYIFGFSPSSAATGTIRPVASGATDYSGGAVMTLSNLKAVGGEDLCVVVGVKYSDAPITDVPSFGAFAFQKQDGTNYISLLLDHLFAAIQFNIKIGAKYSELRNIFLKKMELQSLQGVSQAVVTLTANGDGTNPITNVSYTTYTPTAEEGPQANTVYDYGTDQTNTTGLPLKVGGTKFVSYCAPITGIDKQLKIVCTYDVYNKKGTKVRENCTAENDLSGIKDVTIARGKKVVVNLTVEPTYLYQLSEDELDNPTIKSE